MQYGFTLTWPLSKPSKLNKPSIPSEPSIPSKPTQPKNKATTFPATNNY